MHWTALLARKDTAPGAMIVSDLACVGCGYNLRGAPANGRCAECGKSVCDSLRVLGHPGETASGLRGLAWGFGGIAAVLLVVFGFWSTIPGLTWVGLGFLACFGVYRAVSVYELRYRCGLENMPAIGPPLRAIFWLALLEPALLVLAVVLIYLASLSTNPGGAVAEDLLAGAAALWFLTVLAMAVVIGTLGTALAALLGYGFVEREFQIQRALILVGLAAAALFVLLAFVIGVAMSAPTAGRITALVALGLLLLAWAGALGFTVVGLLHLAAASERDLDVRDDVIGGGRPSFPEPTTELPPIALDRDDGLAS